MTVILLSSPSSSLCRIKGFPILKFAFLFLYFLPFDYSLELVQSSADDWIILLIIRQLYPFQNMSPYYRKFFKKMGTNESKQLLVSKYNWKELISKKTDIEGHPSLVQDEFSLQLADCYEIPMQGHLDYHRKLMIRRNNIEDPCIIKVIDAQIKQKTILQCGTMDVVQVFTEAVPHRFDDIQLGDIEAMLVLQQVIRGCQILCQFAGNYFMICPKMIGFMENGRIKVWLNQNFGKLEIEQKALLRSQQDMLKTIMSIFGSKLTRKYDFLQSFTFDQAACAIQKFLKPVNKTMVLAQIQAKLKKKQLFHNPSSSKKISMSDKSINGCKPKGSLNHRPSIDRSFEHLNILSQIKTSQYKQNCNNYRIPNQVRNPSGLSTSCLKLKKTPLNASSTSIKISLVDLSMNSMSNYTTIHPQKVVMHIAPRPSIRIHYENNRAGPEKSYESSRINCKLTTFPKEESFETALKPPKSSLRSNCRQFSEIIQRSQEGQNTQSQTSEMIEQFYNQLGQDNIENPQNSNLHVPSHSQLIMTADPQWS